MSSEDTEIFAVDISETIDMFVIVEDRTDDVIAICTDAVWAEGICAMLPVAAHVVRTRNVTQGSVIMEIEPS